MDIFKLSASVNSDTVAKQSELAKARAALEGVYGARMLFSSCPICSQPAMWGRSLSSSMSEVGRSMAEGLEKGWKSAAGTAVYGMKSSTEKRMAHASVDFASSALGKSSAATVNGVMAAGAQSGGGEYNINLVVDGRTIATAVFDPLNEVSKQRGVPIGA